MQCSGLTSQTCNSSGNWQTTQACPYVCSGAGVCSGTRVPGRPSARGSTLRPATRRVRGRRRRRAPSCAPTERAPAPGVSPTSTRCNGNEVQTCDATGTWQNTTSCPFCARRVRARGAAHRGRPSAREEHRDVQLLGHVDHHGLVPVRLHRERHVQRRLRPRPRAVLRQQPADLQRERRMGVGLACPYVCTGAGVCWANLESQARSSAPSSTSRPRRADRTGSGAARATAPPSERDDRPSSGVCGFTCDAGYTDCSGACVNLTSDSNNCASCGRACCGGGACSSSTCEPEATLSISGEPAAVDNANVQLEQDVRSPQAPFLTASPATNSRFGQCAGLGEYNGSTVFWSTLGQSTMGVPAMSAQESSGSQFPGERGRPMRPTRAVARRWGASSSTRRTCSGVTKGSPRSGGARSLEARRRPLPVRPVPPVPRAAPATASSRTSRLTARTCTRRAWPARRRLRSGGRRFAAASDAVRHGNFAGRHELSVRRHQ